MPATLTRPEFRTELGMILDALPQPAILLNTDRRVLAVNHLFKSRFGDQETDTRPPCYRLLHGQTRVCKLSGETCPIDLCWQTGEASRTLHLHSSRSGAQHVDVMVRPITDEAGRIDSFLQILTPVEIARAQPSAKGLVGCSKVFNRMLEQIERLGEATSPVLITGAPGTGKEMVARAIHAASSRARQPFVPIDCSSLGVTLFEREAFGHVRGAYPGANHAGEGLIAAADGGTIFLDEVSELPMNLQARVLRLVETGGYRPEGSSDMIQSDFRVLSSSEKDLTQLAHAGVFRRDLITTLSTFELHVPDLKDRIEDVPLLAQSLLDRLGSPCEGLTLHPLTIQILEAYEFPGNVRELLGILERACLLVDGPEILPNHLPSRCLLAYERRGEREDGKPTKKETGSRDSEP